MLPKAAFALALAGLLFVIGAPSGIATPRLAPVDAAGAPAPSGTVTYAWTNLTASLSTAPPEMNGQEMVWDAADHYVVLFGGDSPRGALSSTWSFTGHGWTKLATSSSPPSVNLGAMAYDANDGYVLMFGGNLPGYSNTGGTWTYRGGNWTQLSPSVSPRGRSDPTMAYDADDREVVLFGGCGPANAYTCASLDRSTWTFSSGTWTRITPTHSPPAGYGSAVTYDPSRDSLVLFGGCTGFANGNCVGVSNETWMFHAGNWSRIHILGASPPGQNGGEMVYDPMLHGLVLFGGARANQATLNGTWLLHGRTWTQLNTTASPPSRLRFGMAYDPALRGVVLFAGATPSSSLDDTWVLT